ncbi:MAG: VgrG-related protein, partial [Oscillochloris sp.]|nr:VgrG-related protein [Oscillochloris sp.]
MTSETFLSQLAIQIDGQPLSAAMASSIEQILVETSLHLPGVATLTLHDPTLGFLDNAALEPGKAMKITGNGGAIIFDGEIIEVEAELSTEGHRVIIRAFDRLHRLARGAHTRAFTQVSDADIVKTCASEAGLTAKSDSTPGQHAHFIQANETDLAMLQRRAAANGYLLYTEGQDLCFKKPSATTTINLALNETLSVFRPRLSAIGYVGKTSVRGWDPKQKQAVIGESQNSSIPPQIGLSAKNYLNITPTGRMSDIAIQNQDQAKQVAQALTDAQISRFIEAEGICLGDPKIKAGVKVTISGVGTRFSGTYLITSATHRLVANEPYITEFSISGLNASSLIGMLVPPPAEVQAALGGLTIGIVTDNKDPDHLGRVKLKFPLLLDEKSSQEMVTDWVRIASPSAGNNRGMLFMPEVNDEVVVGFGQGNINTPFVLGV